MALGFVRVDGGGCFGREVVLLVLLFTFVAPFNALTRAVRLANLIASTTGRPVVNTDMMRGNAAGKIVASFSNGFTLDMSPGTAVVVSCINCTARRIPMGKGAGVQIALGRSARVLSRIMIINCKAVGGDSVANTVSSMSMSSLMGHAAAGPTRTLRNGVTNMGVVGTNNGTNTNIRIGVHNIGAFNSGRPLCVVSNFPNSVRGIGPRSVRSVRMLGSNTTTTVCNSITTGNIVVMAAGGNGGNSVGVSFDACMDFADMTGGLRLLGTRRCGDIRGRVCRGCVGRCPSSARIAVPTFMGGGAKVSAS